MKLKEAAITILVNQEYTKIELIDKMSFTIFAEIILTPEQLSQALSRLAYTPCKVEVAGLEKLNKKMECKSFSFEIPKNVYYSTNEDELKNMALKVCPTGWIPDNYYHSRDSFFNKDNKYFARTTIRRWIEIE